MQASIKVPHMSDSAVQAPVLLLRRGSFLPECQQRTKTKTLCFPGSKEKVIATSEVNRPRPGFSINSAGLKTSNGSSLQGLTQTWPLYAGLYLVLISIE